VTRGMLHDLAAITQELRVPAARRAAEFRGPGPQRGASFLSYCGTPAATASVANAFVTDPRSR